VNISLDDWSRFILRRTRSRNPVIGYSFLSLGGDIYAKVLEEGLPVAIMYSALTKVIKYNPISDFADTVATIKKCIMITRWEVYLLEI
jgi:hypothetical protein